MKDHITIPADEPKKLEVPTGRPEAAFHWPPDRIWPFRRSPIGERDVADDLVGGAVIIFLKAIRKPIGIILPWDEVKRRAFCDALDKCAGNYLLAARLLGIGRTTVYRMARLYNYQPPMVQGRGLMTVSQWSTFQSNTPTVRA